MTRTERKIVIICRVLLIISTAGFVYCYYRDAVAMKGLWAGVLLTALAIGAAFARPIEED